MQKHRNRERSAWPKRWCWLHSVFGRNGASWYMELFTSCSSDSVSNYSRFPSQKGAFFNKLSPMDILNMNLGSGVDFGYSRSVSSFWVLFKKVWVSDVVLNREVPGDKKNRKQIEKKLHGNKQVSRTAGDGNYSSFSYVGDWRNPCFFFFRTLPIVVIYSRVIHPQTNESFSTSIVQKMNEKRCTKKRLFLPKESLQRHKHKIFLLQLGS